MAGRLGNALVLGLPGNPVSAYVTCFLFALPLVRKPMGADTPLPPVLPLPLGAAMPSVGNRPAFIRGTLADRPALPFRNPATPPRRPTATEAPLFRRAGGTAERPADPDRPPA